MEYIDVDKALIPYFFEIDIKNEIYKIKIDYNNRHDFFTVDLFKDEKVIIVGEKLVYGKPLFLSSTYEKIPSTPIVPLDLTNQTNKITFENLNEQVFLFLIEEDGDD